MRINIHNHTKFSDGIYDVEDIVREGKKCLDVVGIADHYETRKVKSIPRFKVEEYIEKVRKVGELLDFKVLVGIEVDFTERTIIEEIPSSFSKLDFVLFEYVNDFRRGGYPLSKLLEFSRRFSLPLGLAHSDIESAFGGMDYDTVLKLFESHRIFVELNTSKLYTKLDIPYYRTAKDFFEKLREYSVGISIGSDTHFTLSRVCDVEDAYSFIKEMELEENLEIFLKRFGL